MAIAFLMKCKLLHVTSQNQSKTNKTDLGPLKSTINVKLLTQHKALLLPYRKITNSDLK